MTDIPWDQVTEVFINLIIALVPCAVTIALGGWIWKFWLRVTGLK